MDSIVTKRLFVGSALLIAFIGACGSAEPTDSPANDGGPKPVCTSDAACEKDEPVCDPHSGCVECLLDAHCEAASHCIEHECVEPTTCTSSEDCDRESPVCNTMLGECVGCLSDGDCDDEALCLEQRCTSVTECGSRLDCDDDEVCDRTRGYCVQCAGDDDCGEESLCVEGSCVLRCDSDNDCEIGDLHCAAEGHCVECTEHDDCPDEYNCHSGRCVVDECEQDTSVCVAGANAIRSCNDSGTESALDPCPLESTCSESRGDASCLPWACTPGETVCDGTLQRVCNADGSALEVAVDCSDNDEACYEGECLRCTPNSVGCVDNARAICEADGAAYVVGPPCDADELCVSGSCLPVICEADTLYCEGQVIYRCASDGRTNSVAATCEADSFCKAGYDTCQPDICEAGEPACDGETVATCADDGGGYVDGTTDCAASDQVCDLTACVTAAEDTLGAAVTSLRLNSALAANRYYVTNDRTLTEIQQHMAVSGTSEFTWAVYEESTHENYTKIFESQNLSPELSFHSSGTISVPLLAGRSYMIGVHVVGVANPGVTVPIEVFASFGRVTGATVLQAESALPSSWLVQDDELLDSIFYQTLTTEVP